ncbi:HAD family hydrolase [Paenibacillus sp. CAU 1782]
MSIAYIWFDLGYTLLYQERESIYARYLEEQGKRVPLRRIEEAYHLTDKYFMRVYPGVLGKDRACFFPWYLGVLNHTLGLQFDLNQQNRRLAELQQAQGTFWRAFPFAVETLKKLRASSFKLGLISNWDHTARQVLQNTGLLPLFHQVVISSEEGVEKPDPAIFKIALERAGVEPGESLYVGDNYYDDVIGSERAGMQSFLINRFGRLGIQELPEIGLISSIQELPQLLTVPSKIIS